MPAAFTTATAVRPGTTGSSVVGEPRTWSASLPSGWDVPTGVHGGMLLATTLRAATGALALAGPDRAVDPDLQLRHAHASFLARPDGHDLALATTILRRGATTAHVDATARSEGAASDALGVRALFTRQRDGDAWLDASPPGVPAPSAMAELQPTRAAWPMSPPPILDHIEMVSAPGALPGEAGWAPGRPARYQRWSRYCEAPTTSEGVLDPLCLLPLADLPGPAVWTRFGPGEDLRVLVSLEMSVDLLEPAVDEWVLSDFRARWMGDGYVLVDADLWSADRLVASVRQTMLVRRVPLDAAP